MSTLAEMPAAMTEPSTRSVPVPEVGETVAGKYVIEGLLGQGGMGAVLSARNIESGKRVALKWVRPGRGDATRSRERLEREARLAGGIAHPNVVTILDQGEDRESSFLVMELLEGDSLNLWVERGPHAPDIAIPLMMPVLRAVAAIHRSGVVHRDLKAENVILCSADEAIRPTVFDFGISRSAGVDANWTQDRSLTQTGITVGTPIYMAPEQLSGATEIDPRFDVYALGVMLYELLSGGQPFESEGASLLIAEKVSRDAIPITQYVSDLSPALVAVVMRALARQPNQRWPSVDALGRALSELQLGAEFSDGDPYYRGAIPSLEGAAGIRRAARKKENARWPLLVVAAVGLAVISVAAVTSWFVASSREDSMTAVELEDDPVAIAPTAPSGEKEPAAAAANIAEPTAQVVEARVAEPPVEGSPAEEPPVEGSPAEAVEAAVASPEAPAEAEPIEAAPVSQTRARPRRGPRRVRRGPRRVRHQPAGTSGRLRVDDF